MDENNNICSEDLKCPVCGNPINWTKNVGDYHYNAEVVLLAECWSGDTEKEMPRHLFLIKLDELPELDLRKERKEEDEEE